jgi:dihydroorotate dehydrogenase electron transfer subunit
VQLGLPQPFTIQQIITENSYNKTFILDSALTAIPGQFVMAWLPGLEDKPFSIANADPLSLTVAAVGPFSKALHQLQAGDAIWVRGPLGRGYHLPARPREDTHILLIGGGYGVAPLRFLADVALEQGYRVSVIVGARSRTDLLLIEAFEQLDVGLWFTTEDGSAGIRGRVTDAVPLALAASQVRPLTVYSCGPTGMLQAVASLCAAEELAVQLSWEAHMRCGIGLCGSCEVGQGWLTCLDGPVFNFDPTLTNPPQPPFV